MSDRVESLSSSMQPAWNLVLSPEAVDIFMNHQREMYTFRMRALLDMKDLVADVSPEDLDKLRLLADA